MFDSIQVKPPLNNSIEGTNYTLQLSGKLNKDIYLYYNPKNTMRIRLKFSWNQLSEISLNKFIVLVVRKLKRKYLQEMPVQPFCYSIFQANQTGSKIENSGELDRKLTVKESGVTCFYLQQFYNPISSSISSSFEDSKSIKPQKPAIMKQQLCCLGLGCRNL